METAMRFSEIGQQLRAYRLESGLRAEEIAARLGVSRAALYRYEKGEVIKLDTVKRLADLLKVSPLSLLGIGVEYYSRSPGFLERMRQVEESADQILTAGDPFCFLTTSEAFDHALAESMAESARAAGSDAPAVHTTVSQVLSLLSARKQMFQARRPGIIAILSGSAVSAFLKHGLLAGADLPAAMRDRNRALAASEMRHIAELMETEPMGLQFGLLASTESANGFAIVRGRDRATLAVNPFRADSVPGRQVGVAMITSAEEAIAAHQRVAETMWRQAVRGPAAADQLRALIASRN